MAKKNLKDKFKKIKEKRIKQVVKKKTEKKLKTKKTEKVKAPKKTKNAPIKKIGKKSIEKNSKKDKLMAKGKERGFLTYDEILKEFPTIEEDVVLLEGQGLEEEGLEDGRRREVVVGDQVAGDLRVAGDAPGHAAHDRELSSESES